MGTMKEPDRLRELNEQLAKSSCVDIMNRIYKFNQSLEILLNNLDDLEKAVHCHVNTNWPDIRDREARLDMNRQLFHIVRHLHNSVAAALSLVDHTRVFYNKYYKNSEQLPDFDERVRRCFLEDGVTQFVKNLRQYCQHYRSPMTISSLHIDNEHGRHKRTVGLHKSDLVEFSNWSAVARRYLNGLPEEIDFMEIMRQYEASIVSFHDWFLGCLKTIHAQDIDIYNSIMNEIEQLTARDYGQLTTVLPRLPTDTAPRESRH
jgi:uncharacterized protein YdiU (UPF0061 family)